MNRRNFLKSIVGAAVGFLVGGFKSADEPVSSGEWKIIIPEATTNGGPNPEFEESGEHWAYKLPLMDNFGVRVDTHMTLPALRPFWPVGDCDIYDGGRIGLFSTPPSISDHIVKYNPGAWDAVSPEVSHTGGKALYVASEPVGKPENDGLSFLAPTNSLESAIENAERGDVIYVTTCKATSFKFRPDDDSEWIEMLDHSQEA